MKKALIIILVIALLLIGFAGWSLRDEQPSALNLAWQQWHEQNEGQVGPAYLWLVGLNAPAGESPLAAGMDWLEATREEYESADDWASAMLAGQTPPWQDQALATPDSDTLDTLLACRQQVEPPCDDIESKLAEHAELLARFRAWPVEQESLRVAASDMQTIPAYSPLFAAVQLDRLDQLRHLLRGENELARILAEETDRKLRAHLSGAHSLINLMVAVRLLADQTDWHLSLHDDGLIDLQPEDPLLAELGGVDQGLETTFRGEFGYMDRFNQNAEIEMQRGAAGWSDRATYRWFFKPVMGSNHSAELMHWLISLDQPGDLSALGRGEAEIWRDGFRLRNAWAFTNLNMLPTADPFLAYVARVHDLSAKLALARARLSESVIDDAALQRMASANPYGHDFGIERDRENGRLCFDGPFDSRPSDEQHFRCISD